MSDDLKKLTGKNPQDFEPVAYGLINNSDVELFSELVSKEDFLFDFVKQNVANRLEKVCNESNYLNLLNFLKYYSPSYEDFIISILVKYADDDLTDKMLNLFENGTNEEKTYCAKFFSYVKNSLAMELLKKYAFSDNNYISSNCASALAQHKETSSYNQALEMLNSTDEFTRLDGVRFLVSYGNTEAVDNIISAMKTSSMAENMAGDVLYLTDLIALYKKNKVNGLFVVNTIINGLGEILSPAQVFDFQLYEFFETLIKEPKNSQIAVLLLNAIDKFETLTENDEYLFDESKETKQEIQDIKKLLSSVSVGELYNLSDTELKEDSLFIYTALEFTENEQKVRNLLSCNNPTIILKSLEILKQLDEITPQDKQLALNFVNDENIRNVINAI